jgi:DNA (cytosine-5)-methyltransferase 1
MRALDLFCGAGGVTKGLQRAGFHVTGIDLRYSPRYCGDDFIRTDAIAFLEQNFLMEFDFIWASPPCQRYTCLRSVFDSSKYPDLIPDTRKWLVVRDRPFVIENVVGAPLRRDLTLCAAPFGLRSYRYRIFECSFPVKQPDHPKHTVPVNRRKKNRRGHWDAGGFVTVVGDIGSYVGPEAMGIDWMTGNELSQAIPPAYSQYIAEQFLAQRI